MTSPLLYDRIYSVEPGKSAMLLGLVLPMPHDPENRRKFIDFIGTAVYSTDFEKVIFYDGSEATCILDSKTGVITNVQ